MEPEELASKLKELYDNAADGEVVVSVHLFGIKYAKFIKDGNASAVEIAKLAGISEKYGTEINKGCRLAKYVVLK